QDGGRPGGGRLVGQEARDGRGDRREGRAAARGRRQGPEVGEDRAREAERARVCLQRDGVVAEEERRGQPRLGRRDRGDGDGAGLRRHVGTARGQRLLHAGRLAALAAGQRELHLEGAV